MSEGADQARGVPAHVHSPEQLRSRAASPQLSEDGALALLARHDLPAGAIEALATNAAAIQHRRVQIEIAKHPRAPRHVSLPILRRLYTFELMQVALAPAVAADLKLAAEELLIARLETISSGERLTLAKRGSAGLAAALLLDSDARIIEAALHSPFMTESAVVKALMKDAAPVALAALASQHPTWSARTEVQVALLQCGKLPVPQVQILLRGVATPTLRSALAESRIPALVRAAIHEELNRRPQEHENTGHPSSRRF